jgi:ATP/maltotriose-dependent transcriptional regulator MalT
LISAQSQELMLRGDTGALIKWIGAIPVDALYAHPGLRLRYAVCLLTVAQLDGAEAALSRLETEAQGDHAYQGIVAALRSTLEGRRGNYTRAIEHGEKALHLLPSDDIATRSRVYFVIGISYTSIGQLDEAEACLSVAHGMGQQSGDLWASIGGAAYLAQVYWLRGRLGEAAALDGRAIQMAGTAPAGANAR